MVDDLQIILLTAGTMLDKSGYTVVTLPNYSSMIAGTKFYQNNLFNNITGFTSLNYLHKWDSNQM